MTESAVLRSGSPRRGFALTIVLTGSVAISFAGVLVRMIETADAWQINFYRAIAQMAFVLLVLVVQHRGAVFSRIMAVGMPGILGGLALAGASVCYMESITTTTVANTLFLLSAIPLVTALLARLFLNERLQRSTLIAMGVAALGIVIMLGEGFSGGSVYGNVMGVITVFGFSTFAVIIRKYRDLDMMPSLLVSTGVLIVAAYVVKGGDVVISDRDILICAIWGVFLIGLANWTFIIASRHLEAAEVTFFMLLEFAIGPLWVWLLIGETATVWTLVGGALVIGSVSARAAMQIHQGRRAKTRPLPIASP